MEELQQYLQWNWEGDFKGRFQRLYFFGVLLQLQDCTEASLLALLSTLVLNFSTILHMKLAR